MTLTNQGRSARCGKTIAANSDDDSFTNLTDFLADAMHWCHINKRCFDDALDTALMHFDAEIAGDDANPSTLKGGRP